MSEPVTLTFIFQTIGVIFIIIAIGIVLVKIKVNKIKENKMSMPFTDEDLQQPVSTIIKDKIAPMLAKDGGAIELLQIKNSKVYIQLQGSCVGCAASNSTLKFIVEKELKTAIHPELEIINVPQGIEKEMLNG